MSEFLADIGTNLKIAFKSVKFNYKQYLSFFAALFLIQCFFGMLTTSSDLNRRITDEIIYEEYDYDIVFLDMNYTQMIFLRNDELRVFVSDHIYDIVRIVDRYHAADNTTTYDIYLDFVNEDMEEDFAAFKRKYVPYLNRDLDEGDTLRFNYSEIYKMSSYHISSLVSYIIFAAIMTLVSILLITSIYRIRVNHYKFTYGIYMSFGADFAQLCKTSFWEMTVVSLVTFLPSQLFSNAIIYLIYTASGFAFSYDPWSLLKIFIINMIIVAVSVCFPMWRVSRTLPTKLITSEDNSNLVTSPRRSFDFYGLKFPQKYELASMWRFRRYLAVMLITAVGFSSVFVAGNYVADFYKYTLEYQKPQFSATVEPSAAADETLLPDLAVLDGVHLIAASADTYAPLVNSHTLFPKSSLKASASSVTATPQEPDDPENVNFSAANEVTYILADSTMIDTLTSDLFDFKITGDPYKLLEDDSAVIVSNYLGNKKIADFKVGDKIKVGAYAGAKRKLDTFLQGLDRLREELKFYKFNYTELTVCAVIDGMDTLDGMPIYVAPEVYRTLVNDSDAMIDKIDIYVAPETTLDECKTIFDTVRDYASLYNGKVSLIDNHTISMRQINRSHNYFALIIAISFLVLAISPLIWFFSQTLFVKKREKEFSVLLWLGTIKADIKRLSKQNGLILAGISAVLCIALSLIVITLIQLAVTRIPPALYGGTESYYFSVYVPIPALLISTVLSIICGYISSILPLGSFFKRFAATENSREFDASDDQ